MHVCERLFDEVVKIKFSPQATCHEEVARSLMLFVDQNGHLHSVSFNFLCQGAVLCGSCTGAFMIMADGKNNCFLLKVELRFDDDKISATCCVR